MEQILSKQLHKKDADCMNYTMELMDKLEQVSMAMNNRKDHETELLVD